MAETTPKATADAPSVDELLAGFATAEPEKENPAEAARKARVTELEGKIQELANDIVSLAQGAEDEDALVGALKSLRTVRSRSSKAIRSVPDQSLGFASTPQVADLGDDADEV